MYDNIGGKIKGLAKIIAWIGIVIGCIGGLVVIIRGIVSQSFGFFLLSVLLGAIVAGVAFLCSWVGSFMLYGYGQLIENTDKLVGAQPGATPAQPRRSSQPAVPAPQQPAATVDNSPQGRLKALQSLRERGVISAEEYEEKRQELLREVLAKRAAQQAQSESTPEN